ncbi:hypothetical protein [Pleurocapsa sp. FMAR1]|uniref:hypothetical protein n=1 Tax=Pleurocapsa sp. FMAR1 TaxID=3040204 RepID=UPI0029C864DB|nr:hypothetical protein [Pleurocapsa sp. FMAR1]
MEEINFSTSACRFCHSYKPEGRRGGSCQRLGVPVQGSWKACTLASHPFKTTLKKLEDIFHYSSSVEPISTSQLTSKVSEIEIVATRRTQFVKNKDEALS